MRLLNIETLAFQEFYDEDIPAYYILSHRWSDNEVSFKDFSKRKITYGAGYRKIIEFCEFAKSMNAKFATQRKPEEARARFSERCGWIYSVEWVWIDTCCRSSSNQTKAIS